MKILHVIASMDPKTGGVCQAVHTLADGLSKIGIYNEVVSLDESVFNQTDIFTQYALGPAKGPWYYGSQLLPWLLQNVERFDAVILHGLWLYHGYAVERAFKQLKKQHDDINKHPRFFVMPHGMLDPYFQRAKGRRMKAFRNALYWRLIEKNVVNRSNGLLFTCETELQLAREPFWPYKPKRETVVGLGVEEPPAFKTEMINAFKEGCPEIKDSSYLLFLSRINEKKGTDLLIKAYLKMVERKYAAIINQDLNSIPKLVIAGPGLDTAYGKQMQQWVAQSALIKDLVYFPGMLSGNAKWGAFYGCDAFVLPSHQENFGIAVVEAMACKKPVLISNQVNIWREIKNAGGALVANDDEEGIIHQLKEWNTLSPKQKMDMGINGRHCYEQFFAVKSVINRFHDAVRVSQTQ
ncbi:glycosyltransferase [Mucilaginibacter sp. SP1R1]|uniref:glycosyltransferase n=1 Tax=Mucilaginibacter sp. SP1R1 TaxID=2723091 RepID=UPI0016222F29|nr:glycosyltransferase [Mucilaginibacter sp. SP1R1]MBB6149059.1 glycosyltransferase involved in cell wall biosynthesis [Mucilaginibacter sp. SP1R1]